MAFLVRLAIAWGVNAAALWAANALWDGVSIHGWAAYLIGAAILGIANTILKPILRLITLPLAVITLGLAWFFVSMLMLWITDVLSNGIDVHGFWAYAIDDVGAGLATVLGNLQVLLVGLLAWAFLGEKAEARVFGAIPVVLIGVVLISGAIGHGAYGKNPAQGVLFGALTGLTYSFFILVLRHDLPADTPVVFGRARGKYFFGLPGNPVSTMVTFELFAKPMIEGLSGMRASPLVFLHARLKSEIKTKTGLKRFLPGKLAGEFENCEVELAGWHGSGDVASTARANCYIVIPPDRERIAAGEWVAVMRR